jgi:hypothetical protein
MFELAHHGPIVDGPRKMLEHHEQERADAERQRRCNETLWLQGGEAAPQRGGG